MIQLKTLKLKEIHPYPNNPRKNNGAVDAVIESINQCGYIAPIVVDEDGVILAGHTRYKALKKIGRDEAEVIVKEGLTDEQKKKYRVLDNKTGELAKWDFDLLAQELDELDFGSLELEWGVEEKQKEIERQDIEYQESISVVVECDDERQAEELFDRLMGEGYKCHISTL